MNISGITSTASIMNMSPDAASGRVDGLSVDQAVESASNADLVILSAEVSTRVLDMAQDMFEDAAAQLIKSMTAAMTGIGQNIDIRV